MSQQVTQSVSTPILVLLSLDDVAVTGLTSASVTCVFMKSGGSFAAKTLNVGNFSEKGNGVYTVTFTAAELDTLGPFTVVITGASIDQSTTIANIVAASATTVAPVTGELCTLVGHVVSPAGVPKQNAQISVMIFGHPAIEQYSLAVADDLLTALTDANGYFQIAVLRLAEVEVFIPSVSYRRRLTVPNQASANLFTEVV